jgi:hypothetical protein
METNIARALVFATLLVDANIKYVWWLKEVILGNDCGPFWAVNAPIPQMARVQQEGICCTGVLNLIRRYLNLPVPGVREGDPMAGGTGAWEEFLAPSLQPIDPTQEYPEGSILFRRFHSFEDQGHIAILLKGGRLLHSYVHDPTPMPGHVEPGCVIDASWKSSHEWNQNGYYEFVAPPSAWLTPEA